MAKSNGWVNGLKKCAREFFNLLIYGSKDGIDGLFDDIVYPRDNYTMQREVEVELHFTLKIKEDASGNSNDFNTQADLENGSN